MHRWRGRAGGLARPRVLAGVTVALALAGAALVGTTSIAAPAGPGWRLVIRPEGGQSLISLRLPDDGFALRYRNSVYGSLAEERFRLDAAGRLVLTELAADEAALLGEYYEVAQAPRRAPASDARGWIAAPATPTVLDELSLVATRHGQRTLVVEGRPELPLWELTGADTATITLTAEKTR